MKKHLLPLTCPPPHYVGVECLFYFCVEYSLVLRPVYSLPLLLNPHHYRMYDATSQEKDVTYRCEFLGVPLSLPSIPLPFDPPIPLGAQVLWNRVMTSRIAVSDDGW